MMENTMQIGDRELTLVFDTAAWVDVEKAFGSMDRMFKRMEEDVLPMSTGLMLSAFCATSGTCDRSKKEAITFDWLVKHRLQEELVLTHGDLCLPNIFANENGLTGFIDVGLAGVADKWVDIEKCLWSMWANTTGFFGGKQRPFDRQLLFDALGMQPDEDKLRYYGLLDALC